MRGVRRVRGGACAIVAGLMLAGCGGSGSFGGAGVLTSSWGDPQNPLEPANTNEVQGGKVLDMIFRGLKKYDPRTGRAVNMLAERITTPDSRTFTITVKDGWRFSDGEPVTARSFVDAWNYGASCGTTRRTPTSSGTSTATTRSTPTAAGSAPTPCQLRVTGPRTFTVRLAQKFAGFPDTLGYAAYAPCRAPSSPTTPPGCASRSATGPTGSRRTPRAPR